MDHLSRFGKTIRPGKAFTLIFIVSLMLSPANMRAEASETLPIGFNLRGGAHYGYGDILPYSDITDVDKNLAEMQRMGATIVRVFAPNKHVDDEEAARRLDVFLTKAASYNISVIISLIDFYDTGYYPHGMSEWYTGNFQGIRILGDEFFDYGYKTRYIEFIKTVIETNKHHNNIYAWEPGNELKNEVSAAHFISFLNDVNATIKTLDPSHPVATGMIKAAHTGLSPENLYGQLRNIDIITVHQYNKERDGLADVEWAKANGKSAIVEEIGFSGTSDRTANMEEELNFWKNKGGQAFIPWGFVAKSLLVDKGDGDIDIGIDAIWHTDYDSLFAFFRHSTGMPDGFLGNKIIRLLEPFPSGTAISLCRNDGTDMEGIWRVNNSGTSANFVENKPNDRCDKVTPPDNMVFTQPPVNSPDFSKAYAHLCIPDKQERWIWHVDNSQISADFLGSEKDTSCKVLQWPVPKGRQTDVYGCESDIERGEKCPSNTDRSFHNGIDIDAPGECNTDSVVAAADGKVFRIGENPSYGKWIILWHEKLSIWTTYNHLSTIEVQNGKPVKKGMEIAKAGSTGHITGPICDGEHLHFMVLTKEPTFNGIYYYYGTPENRTAYTADPEIYLEKPIVFSVSSTGGNNPPVPSYSEYYGANAPNPSICPPGSVCIPNPLRAATIVDLLNNIINFIFNLAIIITPLMVVIGGFLFVTGGSDPAKLKQGKDILLWTAIGFGVILLAKGLVQVLLSILKG